VKEEKELRIKGGEKVLALIRTFSSTEKLLFGVLVVVLIVSAAILVKQTNQLFLVSVPTQGDQLTEGVIGLPRLVNPVLAFSDVDKDLSALIYSGLMKYDNGVLVPDLAQSYTVSPDALTYTFTLKDNLHFQDGTPVTADDVAFTISKIQDSSLKSPLRANWSNITIKEISSNQIQFILKQPYSPFLANTTVGILPKHIWDTVSTDQFIFSEYNIEPIGTGPYKLTSITRDSGGIPTTYVLTPWSGYSGGEAFISKINIAFYADEKTAVDAYDSGLIDSIASPSPADASDIASSTKISHIITLPLPRIFGVFFNQSQAPILADKAVRQALNMVVDRNQIIKEVLSGYGTPVNGPIPPGLITVTAMSTAAAASTTPSTMSSMSTSSAVTAAKAILVKDGWVLGSDGIFQKKAKTAGAATTTLAFSISTADSPDLIATAQILKEQWAAIGVQVSIKVFQASDFNQNVIEARNYDSILFGESIGNSVDLYAFWHSSQRTPPGLNIAMYVNSQTDKLLESARSELDTAQEMADYANFAAIVQNDIPAVFLYSPDFIYVVPNKVHGLTISAVAVPENRWSDVSTWYIDTDSVWRFFIRKQ
jgi:peptide/nickel transport system substrate-binding protein